MYKPGICSLLLTAVFGGFLLQTPAQAQETTPLAITALVAADVTINSALISWNTNTTTNAEVFYGTQSSYGMTEVSHSSSGLSHSVLLTGLVPNTPYHFMTRGVDSYGSVAISSDQTFTTLAHAVLPGDNPPAQALEAGNTTLTFYDDFDYIDTGFLAFRGATGATWSASLWYKPDSATPRDFAISDSVLTIYDNAVSTIQNSSPYLGRIWTGGYFESRIYCTGHCGFYLASYAWAQLSGTACGTSFCPADMAVGEHLDAEYGGVDEIDIIEAYDRAPNLGQFTVHKSGVGAGQQGYGTPDQTNPVSHVRFDFPISNAWHTYGLLWTQQTLYWYVDNKLALTAPAYQSSWQPSFIVYSVIPQTSAPTAHPVFMQVDWVKVWEPQVESEHTPPNRIGAR